MEEAKNLPSSVRGSEDDIGNSNTDFPSVLSGEEESPSNKKYEPTRIMLSVSSEKASDTETADSSGYDATAKPAPKRGRRKKADSVSEAASSALSASGKDGADKLTEDAPKLAKPKHAPRKTKAATAETNSADTTTTDNPASDNRANASSAEIQVVDVNTVSSETKKKGWWSR